MLAQMRRGLDRGALTPAGQHPRGDIGEQAAGQPDRPDGLKLFDLGQHRLQADVSGSGLDQRQHAVLVLVHREQRLDPHDRL
jgi:hypothetical protein